MVFKDTKAFFFDLDGTLIDSADDLSQSINYMLDKIGKDTKSNKLIKSWVGNGARILVKKALMHNEQTLEELDEALFEKALNIFLNHYKENLCVKTTLYPNVLETLQKLKNEEFMMAIITNKPFEFVEPILKELDIYHYFTSILGGDSLKEKKPHPLPLLHTLKKFNLQANQAIMVGDSKNDILSAKSANVHSIAVSYGYNQNENLSQFQPEIIVDNFGDILNYLGLQK